MLSEVVIDAVELAYGEETSDTIWLKRVMESLAPELDLGMGISGWCYDAVSLSAIKLFHPTLLGAPSGVLEAVHRTVTHPARRSDYLEAHYATPVSAVSEHLGDDYDTYAPLHEILIPMGIRDIVTINAFDVDGRGVAINAFSPHKATLSPPRRHQLERIAAHLISAYRLRRRTTTTEAVLDTEGRVVQASNDAQSAEVREHLTLAARAIFQARGHLRRTQPTEALEMWRALVDGRWSLVDFADADGKRFLVARVNEPAVDGPASLSTRESQVAKLVGRGHSNKLIAYDLGIRESTVAGYLKSAMTKLGIESRAQVVRLFAAHDETNGSIAQDLR